MITQNLIQANATVVTIRTFKENDVYVRLLDGVQHNEDNQMVYGIVTGVLLNGEDVVITATEFVKEQWQSTVKLVERVFKTGADIRVFATTKEKFELHLDNLLEELEKEHSKKRQEAGVLAHRIDDIREAYSLLTNAVAPETETLSYEQHQLVLAEREREEKELF